MDAAVGADSAGPVCVDGAGVTVVGNDAEVPDGDVLLFGGVVVAAVVASARVV